ncbi:hypothetical protein H2198_000752 [Neophaeococcomyces mojaviensis]|uniref:Uncharacterized protein n=1 Tax=Neophaeococcomyces mojaviensis TaxID=3383035 RepID=A0ACC3AIT3_9EURO|nr:hypothetical protein H2198_000752 [Knufia sp. JES_112]
MRQGSILAYLKPQNAPTGSPVLNVTATSTALQQGGMEAVIDGKNNRDVQMGEIDMQTLQPQKSFSNKKLAHMELKDPKATITAVQKVHLDRLRTITATLLPVRYSDKFFSESVNEGSDTAISFVAMYDSRPVGWIRCRIEPFPNEEIATYYQIYIQALGILAPYRGLGLASALLQSAVDAREQQQFDVRSVWAHVWETNEDALEWYERRGFKRVLLQPHYYRRLRPSGAWIVRKDLT